MSSALPLLPDGITFGTKYGDLVPSAKTREEALAIYEACVEHCMRCRPCGREEAEKIEKFNIGYWTGYFSDAECIRVQELYQLPHPYFGWAKDGFPTLEECIQKGMELGAKSQVNNLPDPNIRKPDFEGS